MVGVNLDAGVAEAGARRLGGQGEEMSRKCLGNVTARRLGGQASEAAAGRRSLLQCRKCLSSVSEVSLKCLGSVSEASRSVSEASLKRL